MSQGEGASLLLRIYLETGDKKYLESASKAIRFMLTDCKDNGAACYNNGLCLLEYTHRPVILNGWIFALFGLYDYIILLQDTTKKDALAPRNWTLDKV